MGQLRVSCLQGQVQHPAPVNSPAGAVAAVGADARQLPPLVPGACVDVESSKQAATRDSTASSCCARNASSTAHSRTAGRCVCCGCLSELNHSSGLSVIPIHDGNSNDALRCSSVAYMWQQECRGKEQQDIGKAHDCCRGGRSNKNTNRISVLVTMRYRPRYTQTTGSSTTH